MTQATAARRATQYPLGIYDSIPVTDLPEGRALIDTGLSGTELVCADPHVAGYIESLETVALPVPIDLEAIAEGLGCGRLDFIIGAQYVREHGLLLYQPRSRNVATLDDPQGAYAQFVSEPPQVPQGGRTFLPPLRVFWKNGGIIHSPEVVATISEGNGEEKEVRFIVDTGAPLTFCGSMEDPEIRANSYTDRRDFHMTSGADGRIGTEWFDVYQRLATVLFKGTDGVVRGVPLEVAAVPPSWPQIFPASILGMDVPRVMGTNIMHFTPARNGWGWLTYIDTVN